MKTKYKIGYKAFYHDSGKILKSVYSIQEYRRSGKVNHRLPDSGPMALFQKSEQAFSFIGPRRIAYSVYKVKYIESLDTSMWRSGSNHSTAHKHYTGSVLADQIIILEEVF